MIPLVESRRSETAELCRRRRVRRLEVFGSATGAGEGFDANGSDLDFLVEFLPLERGQRAEAYFGLLEDLQGLFGRAVDLVMARAIRNRYFLEAIQAHREVLYAD